MIGGCSGRNGGRVSLCDDCFTSNPVSRTSIDHFVNWRFVLEDNPGLRRVYYIPDFSPMLFERYCMTIPGALNPVVIAMSHDEKKVPVPPMRLVPPDEKCEVPL